MFTSNKSSRFTSNSSPMSTMQERIAALEECEELRDIYNNQHWITLMELNRAAKTDIARERLRSWAEKNHQIAPVLQWFHQCTQKFGLTFDVYTFVPPSRLLYHQFCQQKIEYHKRIIQEHQFQLLYYEQLAASLTPPKKEPCFSATHLPARVESADVDDSSLLSSCWSVMLEQSPTHKSASGGETTPGLGTPDWDMYPSSRGSSQNSSSTFNLTEQNGFQPLQLPSSVAKYNPW